MRRERDAPGDQPKRFTGKERDEETGLDYFGARYYGSKLGRFTTVDPVYTWKENLVDPQRWNRYAYALNNPLKYVDPNGEDTYLAIHGASYLNTASVGQAHDVGGNFQLAAQTYAREVEARPGFDPKKDAVVVVPASSTEQFVRAVNSEYASGKIAEMAVFSHGYNSGVSLGGELGNLDQLRNYDLREINFRTMGQISPGNFTENAKVDLFGCEIGSGFAASFAEHLGGKRTVSGFLGPAQFKTTGKDVKMVPSNPKQGQVTYP